MENNRLGKILKLNERKEHRKPLFGERKRKAKPRSRTSGNVNFKGIERNKREAQQELDGLENQDRVIALTIHQQIEVVEKLKEFAKDDIKAGCALYAEYREHLNDALADPDGDRIEAWWVHMGHLKTMMERKQQSEFWEGKGRGRKKRGKKPDK